MDSEKCIRPNKHIRDLPFLPRSLGVDACVRAAFCASDRSIRLPYYNSPSSSAGRRPKQPQQNVVCRNVHFIHFICNNTSSDSHRASSEFCMHLKVRVLGGWLVADSTFMHTFENIPPQASGEGRTSEGKCKNSYKRKMCENAIAFCCLKMGKRLHWLPVSCIAVVGFLHPNGVDWGCL